jgi:hypothetical protein
LAICRSPQDVGIQGDWRRLVRAARDPDWMIASGDYLGGTGSPARKIGRRWQDIQTPGVALPALFDDAAGMTNRQYALHGVPTAIDRALRRHARQEAKSLNAIAVAALARGLELDAKPVEYTDLDALVGSWQEDPAFDRAIADFERVDEEAWK